MHLFCQKKEKQSVCCYQYFQKMVLNCLYVTLGDGGEVDVLHGGQDPDCYGGVSLPEHSGCNAVAL